MREYLDLEFREVGRLLPFGYNLERIIDDFIVLAVFIGNDFLPHLPDLHIHENGLERLFEVYMKVLPSLGVYSLTHCAFSSSSFFVTDGYLNESGVINTKRLQVILDEMVEWDKDVFEKDYGDMNWFKGKQSKHLKALGRARRNSLVLTPSQREIFEKVQKFVLQQRDVGASGKVQRLELLNDFPARDREFINGLAEDLHLELAWDEYDENDDNIVTFYPPGILDQPQQDPDEPDGVGVEDKVGDAEEGEGDEGDWISDEEDEEARNAVDRVLDKYRKAKVVEHAGADFEERYQQALKEKMDEWKRSYYMVRPTLSKIRDSLISRTGQVRYSLRQPGGDGEPCVSLRGGIAVGDALLLQRRRFVELVLQLSLRASRVRCAILFHFGSDRYNTLLDLRGVGEMTFNFELARPFRPFEQLMGVMPEASKELLPDAYRVS